MLVFAEIVSAKKKKKKSENEKIPHFCSHIKKRDALWARGSYRTAAWSYESMWMVCVKQLTYKSNVKLARLDPGATF